MSHPRRQQLARLARGATRASGAVLCLLLALLAVSAGQGALGLAVAGAAGLLTLASRHELKLANRSRIGADSEVAVRRSLAVLAGEGWRIRHATGLGGPGRSRSRGARSVGPRLRDRDEDPELQRGARRAHGSRGPVAGTAPAPLSRRRGGGDLRDSTGRGRARQGGGALRVRRSPRPRAAATRRRAARRESSGLALAAGARLRRRTAGRRNGRRALLDLHGRAGYLRSHGAGDTRAQHPCRAVADRSRQRWNS